MSGVDSTFGELLRELRRREGLSQQSLADTSDLSVDAIAALERGRRRAPRAFTVKVLADALGLDPERAQALHRAASGGSGAREPAHQRLPTPTGPLVGRSNDVARVAAILTGAPERLVTLTGPGGIGKTRLALQLVRELPASFPDGIRWLSLETATAADDLPTLVATALETHGTPGRDLLDTAAHEIADRSVLLVLDSCEHLAAACAAACAALLARTTNLRILATSRERLQINGEVRWPLAPLEVPDDDCMPELLESYAATSLFLHQARQLAPGFEVSAAEVSTLTALCRRLDGLPLAVELAAARTAVMSIGEVAGALDDGLDVLRSQNRELPARHQTMINTLDWSFQLLSAPERTVLMRLAVFADGATLKAAEAVVAGAAIRRSEVLPLVEALAAKSLVLRRDQVGVARIGLLDTIRRYALDRLRESGQLEETESLHAAYYGTVAKRVATGLESEDQRRWLDIAEIEAGNFRRAVSFASRTGRGETALCITGSLWRWCYLRGHYAEGRSWSEAALRAEGASAPDVRARALAGAGILSFLQCEYAVARSHLEASLELHRALGDRRGEAWMLQRLGAVAREQGRYDDSETLHEASMAALRAAGEPELAQRELVYLVFVQWIRGALQAAGTNGASALHAQRVAGSAEGVAWGLLNLGAISLYGADLAQAHGFLSEGLVQADEAGFSEGIAWALNLLGVAAMRDGDVNRAGELLAESLERHRALGDEWRTASVLEALAQVSVRRGDAAVAARLLGAAGAIRERIGAPVPGCEGADHDETARAARAALGDASFEATKLVGAGIPLDRLVAAPA